MTVLPVWRILGMALLAMVLAMAMVAASASVALGQAQAGTNARFGGKLPDPPGTSAASQPAGEPQQVTVGMHLLRLTSLDITHNRASLDFWLWFRWTNDALKPYETFELTNGRIDSKQIERVDKVGAVNYACVRVQATLTCFWEVARFPLGGQKLTVELEDNDLEAHQLVYVPDRDNSGIDSGFRVPGWLVDGLTSEVLTHPYATSYGDPRHVPGNSTLFSRAQFSAQLRRMGVFHSFKVFGGLYLSALVAFTVFFVKPSHRLGLIVGAVFTVVASHTGISSYLPEAGVLTLADQLHLVAGAVILVALFETAYSLHLGHLDRENASRKLDRLTFCVTAPLFVAANLWILTG